MCGIVGLFLKDPGLEPKLGAMLTDMLITMTDRGPDSAGIAIYGRPVEGQAKLTVQSPEPDKDFKGLAKDLSAFLGAPVTGVVKDTHIVLDLPADRLDAARAAIAGLRPTAKVMSAGDRIGRDHRRGASVFDRIGSVPGAQRVAVQPQFGPPRAQACRHDLRDRE